LNLDSALNCVHNAAKLSENIISRSIHTPSVVILNEVSHHFFVSIQGADGPFLILTHETAIALDIRTENGSEFALDFLPGHGVSPKNSIEGRREQGYLEEFLSHH
jgi:hypothetical protein